MFSDNQQPDRNSGLELRASDLELVANLSARFGALPRPEELSSRRQELFAAIADQLTSHCWLALHGFPAEPPLTNGAANQAANGVNGHEKVAEDTEAEASRSTIHLKPIAEGTWTSARQRSAVLTAFQTLFDTAESPDFPLNGSPCGICTKVSRELVGNSGWSELVRTLRYEQFGDLFVCFRSQGPQQFNLWAGFRSFEAGEFTPREVAIVSAITGAVEWLPAVVTNVLPLPDIAHLPHRVRVAFRHFRTGKSTKEIAEQMGISQHTVVDYFKRIYRHFGVSSGRELLALLLAEGDFPSGDPEPE